MAGKIRLEPSKLTLKNGSTITAKDIANNGLALVSAAHPGPRPRWYDRFVLWFKPVPKFSPESLETMEIEIRGRR